MASLNGAVPEKATVSGNRENSTTATGTVMGHTTIRKASISVGVERHEQKETDMRDQDMR